ncbi:hypothetical protein [Ralstonia solanacearum]|uniref:hypothetical protein n=1 Tax=Ralstonia solanacearum TaxID=305 RepID=UPI001E2FC379|nr:hypothetical protein [Ralstonia solanacearum]
MVTDERTGRRMVPMRAHIRARTPADFPDDIRHAAGRPHLSARPPAGFRRPARSIGPFASGASMRHHAVHRADALSENLPGRIAENMARETKRTSGPEPPC